MRLARIAAAGALCCLLPACGVFEKRKDHPETPHRVPPHLAAPAGTPAPLPTGLTLNSPVPAPDPAQAPGLTPTPTTPTGGPAK
jgi:hypothetical protein